MKRSLVGRCPYLHVLIYNGNTSTNTKTNTNINTKGIMENYGEVPMPNLLMVSTFLSFMVESDYPNKSLYYLHTSWEHIPFHHLPLFS